ncbi:amidohydrolase family protein [Actinocorallia herbida]|uniref:Amidohydrolase family protein n=1 Tax=Actinocorallia herbida TaxID=58109 RepID=A0A3N1CVA5_9ACTN|nr:amidohydrolase family protein [Actinocorallia herbida]ROO85175.1 amidohydrolase family protein [Actinocorallia herbida]
MPMTLDGRAFRPFDADNHYYETIDAFTRHLDRRFRRRGVQVVRADDRPMILIGEKVNRFIPNPTFDPVLRPGALDPYFRGAIPEGVDPDSLRVVEPIHPEYRDRDARVTRLDAQGLALALLFPTLGCGVEQALRHDVDATMATLHAFNRWLEDDWGYHHRERLCAAPMLSLADPAAAVTELDRCLALGARVVCVRPAPVPGADGRPRDLGHPSHDPFWARLAEAGVPVAFHLSDSGYTLLSGAWGGPADYDPFHLDPLTKLVVSDRAIHDALGAMVIRGVFDRHPSLKVMSIENGSAWVPQLVKRLRKLANQQPRHFRHDPGDALREHVWVAPYFEEDVAGLVSWIGVERVLFGSDWPHGEGLPEPTDYVRELKGFDDTAIRRIMRDNLAECLGLPTGEDA